jgi:hypothetical protein
MIVAAIVFILLGILIKYGKFYFLIAGYNTMPKKEQEKYNIKGIASVFTNAMFGMALLIIIGFLVAKWFKSPKIEDYTYWSSILIGVPYLLIQANSKKYKIKE